MKISLVEKKFLYALLVIILILTLVIIYPFLTVFILAGAFAILLKPLYEWIKKFITRKNSTLASLLTVFLFLVILCVPIFLLGKVIFNQTQEIYYYLLSNGGTNTFLEKINTYMANLLPSGFNFDINQKITEIFSYLSKNIANFFTSTINTILMSILTVFSIFYLLKDGHKWKEELIKLTPLSKENILEIMSSLKDSINRIFKGTFLIAIIQGVLSWIGLLIFGVPSPALWGLVAGFASLVPTLGTSIVFVPSILFLLFTGAKLEALGLLIWAMVLVGTIDNILAPYLISKKSEISPLFILFSILGAISVMGFIGIIIGPLIIGLLYTLISIYKKELMKSN
jgi:predicted PurR-regulated permease PerM